LVVHAKGFRRFPPISAKLTRRKPAAGGYTEALDIVDESDAPDCGKGFPVFPVFPPNLFGWSFRQRQVANTAGTACPSVRRERDAVAIEPSTRLNMAPILPPGWGKPYGVLKEKSSINLVMLLTKIGISKHQ
jgi:hypothetical protein